jgi:hypothetical protein
MYFRARRLSGSGPTISTVPGKWEWMGMGYFRVEMAWKMCGIFPFSHNIPTISPLKKWEMAWNMLKDDLQSVASR